jgi:hypothetical protein
MEDVHRKYVPPSIDQLAFNSRHCGALAKQFWFSVHAEALGKDEMPFRLDPELAEELGKVGFNCTEASIWIGDRLVWPGRAEAALPNPDLPNDVRDDYEEASVIFQLSPRGAAALLRLGIQNCANILVRRERISIPT